MQGYKVIMSGVVRGIQNVDARGLTATDARNQKARHSNPVTGNMLESPKMGGIGSTHCR